MIDKTFRIIYKSGSIRDEYARGSRAEQIGDALVIYDSRGRKIADINNVKWESCVTMEDTSVLTYVRPPTVEERLKNLEAALHASTKENLELKKKLKPKRKQKVKDDIS